MVHHWILLLIFWFLAPVWGQDERYYRQILSGELPKLSQGMTEGKGHQFNVAGPRYLIDLNGDGVEESVQPQKRDGVDWVEVTDFAKRRIFDARLLAMGAESVLYKIKLVSLASDIKALILFLDEGHTAGRKFESTARIFVVSYEKNDLSTMKISPGPHFYHEKQSIREQYFRRDYLVSLEDLNKDGKQEIIVHYGHIQRIMEYVGNGDWKRY